MGDEGQMAQDPNRDYSPSPLQFSVSEIGVIGNALSTFVDQMDGVEGRGDDVPEARQILNRIREYWST